MTPEGIMEFLMKRGTKGTDITGDTFIGKAPKTKKTKPKVDPELQAMEDQKQLFMDFEGRIETEAEMLARMKKQNKEAIERFKKNMDDLEDKATGGRVGLKNGMSRRKFMQIMGGLAALPVVGKFFKTGKVAAPVVEKAAEAASGAPSYFFDLVNKIKIFGKEGRSISPRKKTTTYKNYELEEDLTTGDLTVVKQKGDPDFAYEEEVMVLRKGQADETTKGKTPPDEYEELTVRPDGDGKMKDVDSGIEPEGIKEIIEEVSGEAPSIKKAGGGIARMLGE